MSTESKASIPTGTVGQSTEAVAPDSGQPRSVAFRGTMYPPATAVTLGSLLGEGKSHWSKPIGSLPSHHASG